MRKDPNFFSPYMVDRLFLILCSTAVKLNLSITSGFADKNNASSPLCQYDPVNVKTDFFCQCPSDGSDQQCGKGKYNLQAFYVESIKNKPIVFI